MVRRYLLTAALAVLLLSSVILPTQSTYAAGTVGDGTAGSCTTTALQNAINAGNGLISFNCGGAHTINVTAPLNISSQTSGLTNVTIDGGNQITLSGGNSSQIIFLQSWHMSAITLTLQNITLANGRVSGGSTAGNGGAIEAVNNSFDGKTYKPTLNLNNVTLSGNVANVTAAATGNYYDYGGGAIYAIGGQVNISDSTFSGNQSPNGAGGAIHILQSGLSISGSTFSDNTAIGYGQGGTIYVDGLGLAGPAGQFTITDSSFTGGRTHNAGGAIYFNIYSTANVFSIDRSRFIDNRVIGGSRTQGGAITGGATGNVDPQVRISNSLFADNLVTNGSGGALNFNQRAAVTIANSTFHNNRAEGTGTGSNGGAIYFTGNVVQFQIINSTIANNYAGWTGGGITGSNGILKNTILAYNTAGGIANFQQHCSQELQEAGFNLQYPGRLTNGNFFNDVTCFAGKSAPNQTGLPEFRDPLLGPLLNNGGPTFTLAPGAGSPAIDGGDNAICAAAPVNNLDQRGTVRPVDGDGLGAAVCDLGAYEVIPNEPPGQPALTSPANGASITGNTAALTWAQAAFAVQYRVQVDNNSDFSSPLVNEVITALNYTPGYLGIGVFHWRVQAINPNGTAWSLPRSFTLVTAAGAAPTRHYFSTPSQTLTWSILPWAGRYQIEIALMPNYTQVIYTNDNLSAGTPWVTVNLAPGIYYWRVRGLLPDGNWGIWSAPENFTVGL